MRRARAAARATVEPGGGQQGGGQQGGGGNQYDDGESRNKRRRRRRKNRGGQDAGPQGEDRDAEVFEEEPTGPISNEPVKVEGYLDLRDEGYGFIRVNNYLASKSDSYVPVKLTRQYGLRKGDEVVAMSRPAGRNEKNPAVLEILSVNGRPPDSAKRRPRFEDLTALFPDSRLRMEDPSRPDQHDSPHHRSRVPDRQRPARHHRVAPEGRQDHGDEDDRGVDREEQPRGAPDRAARRRAARRGHRHEAHASRAR